MQCPVCEAENREGAAECGTCGRLLEGSDAADARAGSLDGLEQTQLAPPDLVVQVAPLPGVEHTRFEDDGGAPGQWSGGPLALERTRHEIPPEAASSWTGEVEIERDREDGIGERTPTAEETATCPFCGTPSLEAVCGNCGRQKSRYLAPQVAEETRTAASGESVTCPACYARVSKDVRCSDCGMPFPLQEL